jgi:peptidoglycan-N-acetylmuramic acid deacetylase
MVDRRAFMLSLAAGAAGALSGCAPLSSADGSSGGSTPGAAVDSGHRPWHIQRTKPNLPVVQGGPPSHITHLDGAGKNLALTIDDGVSAEVVSAYIDLARTTGLRLTFFVTGSYPSWTQHKAKLRPLVDSGQIQLANHTWTHADLTLCSGSTIESELTRCERLLNNTFGVTGKPFMRPPYGARNSFVDGVAADLGYTSITMWYGTFGDSGRISQAVLLDLANTWIQPQAVVLGHANYPTVTRLYGQILDIIRSRNLQTVTLDDAWYGARGRNRAVRG